MVEEGELKVRLVTKTHWKDDIWAMAVSKSRYIARIYKLLRSSGIDSKASIPPNYAALRAGTITLLLLGS